MGRKRPKVIIVMPAFNAALTIKDTYKEIPKPYIERELGNIKVVEKDRKKVIYAAEKYYRPEDFFAFRLDKLKVINITDQTKKDLEI